MSKWCFIAAGLIFVFAFSAGGVAIHGCMNERPFWDCWFILNATAKVRK